MAPSTRGRKAERDDPSPRVASGNVVHILRGRTEVVRQAKMDAVRKVYDAWKRGPGGAPGARMDRSTMRELYAAGDFATVKSVIEAGDIGTAHSYDMADLRSAMILEVSSEIAKQKGYRVYRSDSGNQVSGMRSDLDQTVFVYESDGRGGWRRSEQGDLEFVKAFREQFQAKTGFPLESLEIATIPGRDRFPDPRRTSVQLDAEGLRAFSAHAAETMVALRLRPGAYTYCGAVVQQMQLRAEAAIAAGLAGRGSGTLPPRELHPELARHLGRNGAGNLVCLEIGPDGKGEWAAQEVSRERAREVLFEGLPPELRPGHAYDAAVANYLEFMHHLRDGAPPAKYVLRALDDGLRTMHRFRTGESLAEYASVPPGERRAHLERLLGADPTMKAHLDRWSVVFEVSAALRTAHKDGVLSEADAAKALRPLAEEMARVHGGTPESNLARARTEYDVRCQEFLVRNAVATASQRLMEFATYDASDPGKRPRIVTEADESRIREALGLEAPDKSAVWERVKGEIFRNEADLARLQLLYSLREMRPDVSAQVVAQAEAKGLAPTELGRLRTLVAESKEWFFGWKRYREHPALFHEYGKAVGRLAVRQAVATMHEALLVQSGWIDTDAGRIPDPKAKAFLEKVRLAGFDAGLRTFFAKHRAAGITSRYVRNVVFDVGNVVGVLQVLRTYSETGGDVDATAEAMVREAVSALPVVGQIYTLSQAQSVGQAALTGSVMVTCILVPQAGMAALLFSLGEAGLAIYDAEVARPLTDTVADALYRGFIGPPLRAYDKVPAEFTAEDAAALVSAEAGCYEWGGAKDPSAQRTYLDFATRRKILRAKRSAWESYDTERRRTPAWEKLGILSQRGLACPTLLDAVEPMVFYGPPDRLGPVDFTVKPLSSDEEARRSALERELGAEEVEGVAWQDALFAYGSLETRRLAAERAARYLAAARGNRELMHQIRVDSLWPYVAEKANDRAIVDARAFASSWCASHRAALVQELRTQGVLARSRDELPSEAVEELGTRLLDDLTRSRELWQTKRLVQDAERKAEEDRLERRKGAWYGESLAEAARRSAVSLSDGVRATLASLGLDPAEAASPSPLAQAIALRHLPEAVPELEISLRKVARAADRGAADAGMGAPAAPPTGEREEFDWRPDVKVTADPKVYRPPYHAAAFQLDPEAAQAAAASGSYQGLSLDTEAKSAIAAYLKQAGPVDASRKSVDPLVLVFAFCSAVEIPARIVPETLAGLPNPPRVRIPGQDVEAHLLGGAAMLPPPASIPEGDLTLRSATWPGLSYPAFEVESKALRALDPARPDVGVRFLLARATGPEGPFEPIQTMSPLDVYPDSSVWKPTSSNPRPPGIARLADDRVALLDGTDWGRAGGAHYVAVQVAILGRYPNAKVKGAESRSAPVGPGTPRVELFGLGGTLAPPPAPGVYGDLLFAAHATFSEQGCLGQGVEIVVKDRFGERRYWTPRTEDGVRVGDSDSSYGMAFCRAYPGVHGGTITVRNAAGGETRTHETGSDPKTIAARDGYLADARKSMDAALGQAAAEDAADRAALAEEHPWMTAAPTDPKPQTRIAWATSLRDETQRRIKHRLNLEYYHPRSRHEARHRVALLSEEPRAALAIAREIVEATKRERVVMREEGGGYERAAAAIEDITGDLAPDGGSVRSTRSSRDSLHSAERELMLRTSEREAWKRVAEDAWVAADATAFTEALDAMLRLSDRPDEKDKRADVISRFVTELVWLTGDRARGAALRREQEALELGRMSEKDRQAAAGRLRAQLPSCWPVGAVPKAPR